MKPLLHKTAKYPVGATSLLVVTGISLVLIVIISGLTALSIRESRQALDTDLSNRALAAAEASARDAAQILNDDPGLELPNCNGTGAIISGAVATPEAATSLIKPVISESADNTQVVCRTVSSSSTLPSGQIQKDDSVQIFTYLPTNAGINQMELEWGKENAVVQGTVGMYPELTDWPSGAPAAMELSVVSWPKTGVSSSNLAIDTRLIVPTSPPNDSSPKLLASTFIDPKTCTSAISASGYNCKITIDLDKLVPGSTGAVNRNIVVRLRARYKAADYQAKFVNKTATGTPIAVRSSKALIDVTAKVGDLYRRIQAEKPLANNPFFNDVLYSNTSICKTLTVNADYSLIGPNSCS